MVEMFGLKKPLPTEISDNARSRIPTVSGLRSPWVGYSALVLAVPLSTGSVNSLARFGLLAFPLMWPLADWVNETPRRRTLCVAAALVLTALLVAELRINSP